MSSLSLHTPIRLNGRSLLVGRILYGLLLLLCLIIFGISLAFKYVQGTSGCDSIYNVEWAAAGDWCFEWFQAIEDLGITSTTFESYFIILRVVAALPFFGLSLLLVWRRGHELRVLLLASLLLVMGIAGTWFNPFWGWAGGWFENYSAYPQLGGISSLLTFLLIGGTFLFVMLFPDGRFVPGWLRWVAVSWLLLAAGNTFFYETLVSWDRWPFPLPTLVPLVYILFGIGAVIMHYRQATTVQQQQIKWITFGLLLMAFVFLLDFSVFNIYQAITGLYPLTNGQQAVYWELGQDTLSYASQFFLGICFILAILRHRLWDIDNILNRTLVYGGLTLLVILLYIAIVGGLGLLFQNQTNAIAGLIATGIIAVLFQPLRDRLQHGVNRLLYGERDDPAAVLTRLAQQLETAGSPTAILPNLVQTIALTLKIPYVAIWQAEDEDKMKTTATWGQPLAAVETIPLTYQNKIIGNLMVSPRGPNEQFTQQEKQLLNTIAALSTSAVQAVQLSEELRRSRRRIVSAREEERRRLRRDLHDGLGPQLASQTLGLEAAEQLMNKNPEQAQELLQSLKTQAQEAILDVRRLVYELRPPALDDLGLVEALEQSAARYETGDLRFIFDVPEKLPELPAAVETAVYRITQEAMTNVIRHAQATVCDVRLVCNQTHFIVEIVDNGRGLPANHRAGVGLHSMQERSAELNGSCVIKSIVTGGTRVRAQIPLEVFDV